MGQLLEGKINMAISRNSVEKEKGVAKKRVMAAKSKTPRKKAIKHPGFFQTIADQFYQVAPLDWVPTPYQIQIKAAKPVRLTTLRKKKGKGPLH